MRTNHDAMSTSVRSIVSHYTCPCTTAVRETQQQWCRVGDNWRFSVSVTCSENRLASFLSAAQNEDDDQQNTTIPVLGPRTRPPLRRRLSLLRPAREAFAFAAKSYATTTILGCGPWDLEKQTTVCTTHVVSPVGRRYSTVCMVDCCTYTTYVRSM